MVLLSKMARFMNELWNGMVSAMPTTNKGLSMSFEKEPGESSYAFGSKKLNEITQQIATKLKSQEISFESLRESIVSSCDEFNHAHFFMMVQFGILVYYPSIALAIMYQQSDPEQEIEQEQSEQMSDSMMQQMLQQPQPQSQSQFIEMMQRAIIQLMSQKQSLQQQAFMTEQQQKYATKRAIKMVPQKKMMEGDDERFIVRFEEGRQRQTKMVWTTVYIQI